MVKRFFLILLSLCLLFSSALAEDELLYRFRYSPEEAALLSVPEGLQPLYDLVCKGSVRDDVALTVIQMPYGRCLATIAQSAASSVFTQEELSAHAGSISAALEKETLWVGGFTSEAVDFYSYPALNIEVDFAAGTEEASLMVHGRCVLFSMGNLFTEVWVLRPADPIYLYAEDAAAELQDDIQSAEELLGAIYNSGDLRYSYDVVPTLNPSSANKEAVPPESVLYEDPNGYFTSLIPVGSIVLTPSSTDEEIAAVREQYIALNPSGADNAFDYFVEDIREEMGTVVFTADMQGVIEFYREEVPDWQGVTTLDLANLYTGIEDAMNKEYGYALCVTCWEEEELSGIQHVREVYMIRSGDLAFTQCVLGCMEKDCLLREVDICAASTELFDSLYRLVVDSVHYTEP